MSCAACRHPDCDHPDLVYNGNVPPRGATRSTLRILGKAGKEARPWWERAR